MLLLCHFFDIETWFNSVIFSLCEVNKKGQWFTSKEIYNVH